MTRRLALAGLLVVVAVVLARVAGWPDPAAAVRLVTAGAASASDQLEFVALLCWLVVIGLLLMASTEAWRERRSRGAGTRVKGRWRTLALLGIGLALLGAGVTKHKAGYRVCCSSAGTAAQVISRVR